MRSGADSYSKDMLGIMHRVIRDVKHMLGISDAGGEACCPVRRFVLHGCPVHAAPTTWLRHPCSTAWCWCDNCDESPFPSRLGAGAAVPQADPRGDRKPIRKPTRKPTRGGPPNG